MFRFWRSSKASVTAFRIAAAGTILLLHSSAARATVTFVADPTLPAPVDTALFTHDPYTTPPTHAQRGIATTAAEGHRNLRQTFQLPAAVNVGQLIFSVDVSSITVGLEMRIYEIANVQGAWAPGPLVREFLFPTTVLTTNWLGINFTGGDVFTLQPRATGTEGYGIEFADNSGIVGSTFGQLRFNNDSIAYYAGGSYYTESSGASATRDIGLILVASAESPCDPGDVNCDTNVDSTDLGIIAAHFRQSGGRELGDLSGNGFIDFDDFQQWKQNFPGAFPGSGSLADFFGHVPEPTSAVLCFSGVLGLSTMARRRVRSSPST